MRNQKFVSRSRSICSCASGAGIKLGMIMISVVSYRSMKVETAKLNVRTFRLNTVYVFLKKTQIIPRYLCTYCSRYSTVHYSV